MTMNSKPTLSFFAAALELVGLLNKVQTLFRIVDLASFILALLALLVFFRTISPCLEGLKAMQVGSPFLQRS